MWPGKEPFWPFWDWDSVSLTNIHFSMCETKAQLGMGPEFGILRVHRQMSRPETTTSAFHKQQQGRPRDHAVPRPDMYPDEPLTKKDTHTPMFIAALCTMARTWQQPKRPLTGEQVKKMWYTHTMGYCWLQKRMNNVICNNMDGPRDYHTKRSKWERGRQIPYDTTYIWNLKYDTSELIYKTEADMENRLVVLPKRGGWGREGRTGSLGLAHATVIHRNGKTTVSYSRTQGHAKIFSTL